MKGELERNEMLNVIFCLTGCKLQGKGNKAGKPFSFFSSFCNDILWVSKLLPEDDVEAMLYVNVYTVLYMNNGFIYSINKRDELKNDINTKIW